MKVAKDIPNDSTFSQLGTSALYLITTLPEDEKQAQLERIEQGDNPTVRELQEVRHERTTRKYKKASTLVLTGITLQYYYITFGGLTWIT